MTSFVFVGRFIVFEAPTHRLLILLKQCYISLELTARYQIRFREINELCESKTISE
jgi:hypothetical protein